MNKKSIIYSLLIYLSSFGIAQSSTLINHEKIIYLEQAKIKTKAELDSCDGITLVTLDMLENIALDQNIPYKNSLLGIDSARFKYWESKLALMPQFSLSSTYSNSPITWSDSETIYNGSASGISSQDYYQTTYEYFSLTPQISWNILNPTYFSSIKYYKNNLNKTKNISDDAKDKLLFQIRSLAVKTNQDYQNYLANSESYESAKLTLKNSKSLFESGFISLIDLQRQKNQVFRFQNQLKSSQNSLNKSLIDLNNLFSSKKKNCYFISKDAVSSLISRRKDVDFAKEIIKQKSIQKNGELKSVKNQIKMINANIDQARFSYLPQTQIYVSSNLTESYYDRTISSGNTYEYDSYDSNYTVGITSTITFDAGQNLMSIKSLKKDKKIAEQNYSNLLSTLESNILKYRSEINLLEQQNMILKEQLESTKKSEKDIYKTYNLDYATTTDVIDAQRTTSSAKLDVISNKSNYAIAIANLLKLISE